MGRYKLVIVTKGEDKILDLDSIIKLKKLKDLDEFTSSFKNEDSLKIFLYNKDLITRLDISKKLAIMYKANGKIKKIPVIYKDTKCLLDIMYLRAKLKSMSTDLVFLEKLANYYSNGSTKYNKQGINVMDIRMYISDVRKNGGVIFSSNSLDNTLDDLIKKATFKIEQATGELIINYRGVRDLAIFIYKYVSKNDLSNKEKQEIWKQQTLFDLSSNNERSVLSSDGEPDFPPNSEEEMMLLKYIEQLPNEEHPHKIR